MVCLTDASHHTLMGSAALVASSGPCDDIKTFNGTVDRSYCNLKPESSLLKHETQDWRTVIAFLLVYHLNKSGKLKPKH